MSGLSDSALRFHMAKALDLARQGRLRVDPNPTVGALVLDALDNVVGWGCHERWGGPHAEIVALRKAGNCARGGTLVVTLEPCAHDGKKTPPCVPSVVAAGLARVVVGMADPNPKTAGLAAQAFAAAGVSYECGVLRDRCRASVARYVTHLASERPWVIAKWAASLDGRSGDASSASRWISGEQSRDTVHEIRAQCDAVIVGAGTVVADDPSLTSRRVGPNRPQPLRVVFDSTLRTPPPAKLVATARETPTLIVAAPGADESRRAAFESAGVEIAFVDAGPDGRVDVAAAFRALHRRGVRRALLEAGGTLTAACLRAGVVDQVATFVAPVVLGGGGPTPFAGDGWPIADAPRLEEVRVTPVGNDALIEGYWPRKSYI